MNSIEFTFELSHELPNTMTMFEKIDLEWVRARVRENPLLTFSQFAQMINKQFGVKPSISHVLRIQQMAGISRLLGSRRKQVTGPHTFLQSSSIRSVNGISEESRTTSVVGCHTQFPAGGDLMVDSTNEYWQAKAEELGSEFITVSKKGYFEPTVTELTVNRCPAVL